MTDSTTQSGKKLPWEFPRSFPELTFSSTRQISNFRTFKNVCSYTTGYRRGGSFVPQRGPGSLDAQNISAVRATS